MKNLLFLLIAFNVNAQINGKVIHKTSYWNNGNIYTTNYIETETDTIAVKTYGGIVGLQAETVSHTPQLYIGQRGTFFLNNSFLERFETSSNSISANTDISPTTVNAGVGDIITITGSGFGNRSQVRFSNSNFGGAAFTACLDSQILSWTDTEIVAEVPDFAGSGSVRLTLEDGTNIDTDPITIPYAISNIEYLGDAYETTHVNQNLTGGYTWQFNVNTPNEIREPFTSGLDSWRCNSGVNMVIGEDTDIDVTANDGISIVRFSNSGELPGGVLARCTSRFSACFQDGVITWYVTELDITINSDVTFTNEIGGSGFDAETVLVHELGHSVQLGHVINPNQIMHFSISSSDVKRELSTDDIDASNYKTSIAFNNSICGFESMTPYDCGTLSAPDFEVEKVVLYTEFYDLHGRKVTNNLSNGLYLKKIVYIDGSFNVVKVIK